MGRRSASTLPVAPELPVGQEPKFLSADQFLLTTLIVKLAGMALLATMLVRYRRFRHILIFERRAWHDRLIFAASVGIPVAAGVIARLLLGYNAADLTLEGAVRRRSHCGAIRRRAGRRARGSSSPRAGQFIALPFAIGCGFAGGGLREACPKEEIWHFSPFVFTDLPRHLWQMPPQLPRSNWQVVLLAAPVALELLRQMLGLRFGPHRLFYLGSTVAAR